MTFVRKYADYHISSAAFPKLGCGNGELNWNEVKPLMEKCLKDLPIEINIYSVAPLCFSLYRRFKRYRNSERKHYLQPV